MGFILIKNKKSFVKCNKGQTSIEYLLLLVVSFVTVYIMVRGPLATQTRAFLFDIVGGLENLVRNAEWSDERLTPGQSNHPSDPRRVRPLHL